MIAQAGRSARLRIEIGGAVQGVGFRPFVYRVAYKLGVSGWVRNGAAGIVCEAEADGDVLEDFLDVIRANAPPLAEIHNIAYKPIEPTGAVSFDIRTSRVDGPVQVLALPDIATCADCCDDIFDPVGRRYLYPFANCTNCGPRYSIIARLPYDRANTSMDGFSMCTACRAEYANPLDRRFHAQPNCCPECGPQLALWDRKGRTLAICREALKEAATAISDGKIVAVKGLGGFHLFADARNSDAVRRLRQRKCRPHKPFAIMCPDIAAAGAHIRLSAHEADLLKSPQSPIVLLSRCQSLRSLAQDASVCEEVAPGSLDLGVLLPNTPLHHILMRELGFPVVATSGNLSNEPLAYDNHDALKKLGNIADVFLVHDRPILAPVDDSVVRVMGGAPMVLRRARGYSPYPLSLSDGEESQEPVILGVGAHLANTACILKGKRAFVGPHIGDLETSDALDTFESTITRLCDLNEAAPDVVACDLHIDYRSSQYAQQAGLPIIPVQHHVAHLSACMAEHGLEGPVLGIAWDGAGLGDDGTLWGGEFLHMEPGQYRRVAHLRQFQLPGGEVAMREPRRAAFGVLWELNGDLVSDQTSLSPVADLTEEQRRVFSTMLSNNVNAPICSSAGRLFDAVAAFVGLRLLAGYQGQAAAELEWAIDGIKTDQVYAFSGQTNTHPSTGVPLVLDWGPMIKELLADHADAMPVPMIAAKFHNTLVEMIVSVVECQGLNKVVFGGGCFQNKYLTERIMKRMREIDVDFFFPQSVPPNDGGISFGQVVWARHVLKRRMPNVSSHSR
ncbi:MAG: carbamoyltransferase HypF [Parvibaculum sp.]